MAVKFSAFTTRTGTLDASTRIVGYDDPAGTKTNVEFTIATLAANSGIYAADGTIGSGRVATVTDTLTFNNSSNQNILKISNEVCIGQLAVANGNTTVAIGLDSRATGGSTTAVGSYARATNGSSSAFGHSAQTAKIGALVIGYYSKSLGDYGVSVGYACGAANGTAANVVNIGRSSKGEGANSITIASNGSATAPTTANAFGVYMTSNTTPDFEVIGGGESTLNTSLKITGQAYTEQHGTPSAGTTIDWNNGNVQYIQLASGANTLSLSSPKSGATYILQVKQPSSGAAGTITYPTSVKYPGGTKSVLTTDNDAIDIITLIYNGTTTHYYASATLDLK